MFINNYLYTVKNIIQEILFKAQHNNVASFNMNYYYPNVSSNIKKGVAKLNLYVR